MFYQSVEFYVIAAVIAAAIIAMAARPARTGPAVTRLLRAIPGPQLDPQPQLRLIVDDHSNLILHRTGLPPGMTVNMEVTLIGHDIAITEHLMPAADGAGSPSASIIIDFVGRDRYHLSYDAPQQSLFTAINFTVAPGQNITKPFLQS